MTEITAKQRSQGSQVMIWIQENESALRAWGIAAARITLGLIFLMHGYQKMFQFGVPAVVDNFGQLGMPIPAVTGLLITLLELVGGLALIIGLFTRGVALLFTAEFLVAVTAVHLPNGFFAANGGVEFPLMLLAGSFLLVLAGGGALTVDRWIQKRK